MVTRLGSGATGQERRDEWQEAFDRLTAGLAQVLDTNEPVPRFIFSVRDRAQFNARVRHPGQETDIAFVEVNSGVFDTLFSTINTSSAFVGLAVIDKHDDQFDLDVLLTTVFDVAVYFILLHELYHVYEGHLGFLVSETSLGLLSEASLALAEPTEDFDASAAYFFEMEADGAAVASLVSHLNFRDVLAQAQAFGALDPAHQVFDELRGEARDYVFRVVLASAWITTALMELHRSDPSKGLLPSTRLLAMCSGLMAWYAQIDSARLNEHGELIQTLSQEQTDSISRFLERVAKPVCTHLWDFPYAHEPTKHALFLGTTSLTQFLHELKAVVLMQPSISEIGAQLARTEGIRNRVTSALSSFKLFDPLR